MVVATGMDASPVEITRLLEAWGGGDKAALDALVPLVHKELRRLATGICGRSVAMVRSKPPNW